MEKYIFWLRFQAIISRPTTNAATDFNLTQYPQSDLIGTNKMQPLTSPLEQFRRCNCQNVKIIVAI